MCYQGALLRLGEGSELRACLLKLALKDLGSDSTDHLTRGCEGSLHKVVCTASASQLSSLHERLHKQSAVQQQLFTYAIHHSHSPRTSARLVYRATRARSLRKWAALSLTRPGPASAFVLLAYTTLPHFYLLETNSLCLPELAIYHCPYTPRCPRPSNPPHISTNHGRRSHDSSRCRSQSTRQLQYPTRSEHFKGQRRQEIQECAVQLQTTVCAGRDHNQQAAAREPGQCQHASGER